MKQAAPFIEADIFNSESIALVRRAIIKTLNSENYHLVQSAIDGLIYHILIAIQRLNENFRSIYLSMKLINGDILISMLLLQK